MKSLRLSALAGLALLPVAAFAQQPAGPSPAEAKLREALRASTLEVRAARTETSEVRAELDTTKTDLVALKKKSEASAKKSATEAAEAAALIKSLEEKLNLKTKEGEKLAAALNEWRDNAVKAVELGRKTEAERARLEALANRLLVRVADREAKNIELVRLSREILKRYEDFGLGRAIAGREPFIGLARVDLQTLVQDYGDKIADGKVIPGTPAPGEPTETR